MGSPYSVTPGGNGGGVTGGSAAGGGATGADGILRSARSSRSRCLASRSRSRCHVSRETRLPVSRLTKYGLPFLSYLRTFRPLPLPPFLLAMLNHTQLRVDLSTKKSNMSYMNLASIDPVAFSREFAKQIRDVASLLMTISGTTDSIRATESPSSIETIALHVARYAKCLDVRDDRTEGSIDILARIVTNKITAIESDPDYESILHSAHRFLPRTEADTVIVGAHARRCIETASHVRVAWLAVFAGISYDNCTMHVHRGRLKGSKGLVTSLSAKKWLSQRSDEAFERIVRTTQAERVPTKRQRVAR